MMAFYDSQATRMGANIVMSQMQDVAQDLIARMVSHPNGEVTCCLTTGSRLRLRWNPELQLIDELEYHPATVVMEIAA